MGFRWYSIGLLVWVLGGFLAASSLTIPYPLGFSFQGSTVTVHPVPTVFKKSFFLNLKWLFKETKFFSFHSIMQECHVMESGPQKVAPDGSIKV